MHGPTAPTAAQGNRTKTATLPRSSFAFDPARTSRTTFDRGPTSSNSTSSTAHLSMQIKNATNGVTWMSYQEGINSTTGSCPIAAAGFYMPKHDPFIFVQDPSGNPPSKTNACCIAHHKDLSALARPPA
jgi:hypothetical protein